MKKTFKLFLALVVLVFTSTDIYAQGNTTSSINGVVFDNVGEALPGASILATHLESGTRYSGATDFSGNFRISNMRVGGPYEIVVSYIGFGTFKQNGIYLQLGDSKNFKIVLAEDTNELQEVVVKSVKDNTFNSNRTGAQTVINSDQIKSLPSLSRNIADFARLTPQAQISGDDVLSIGGQNNRYNAIYIDGAVNNDVFGLSSSGTNGGQTGVSPISLDAIEQFQVSVSPFDVKLSGFAGGAISAITRSGSNNFEGSTYFFYRDQALAGKTPLESGSTSTREKLADFSAQTYGVRAGGAITKNKLFYFINYERQDNATPNPFDLKDYLGDSGARIPELVNYLGDKYNYNPGSFTNNISTLVSDKLIAKIDWNINDNHKLSFKNSYVKATNFSPNRSSSRGINFLNGSQNFVSTTNSTALELNSRFSNKFSNNLVIGYTVVDDNRDPIGDRFPSVEIIDGSGRMYFGAEAFSTANLLKQRILTVSDNFEINVGKHNISIGTHNEFSYAKNVFVGRNFGYYRYSALQDFLDDAKPDRYRLGYSLFGGSGDDSQGAAEFNVSQFGVYIQDNFKITNNFKFSYGLRVDVPVWDKGTVNEDFNSRTIPLLNAAGKNLQGATVGDRIATTAHYSPRVGFNYDLNGDRVTQFRGGLGIFTSRLPLVWPGGAYNNNGVSQGAIDISTGTPNFNPDTSVESQLNNNGTALGPLPGSGKLGGNIDLFSKNFKLPQVFKASFAVDQKLPAGFVVSGEIIYNDNISAVTYENVNLGNPTSNLTGADTRPRYDERNNRIDNTYVGVFLGSNTSAGKAWNSSITVTKNFASDLVDANISATYAYGKSTVLLDATSSQNSSQWNNIETVNGSNAIGRISRSDFDQGHRVLSNSSVKFKWSNNMKTTIGIFYEGAQGSPFSYVYNDRGNLLQDTFSASALIFVPGNRADINLVSNSNFTADQQWEALSAFIEGDSYLRGRKGNYVERNADRLKWSHVVDLKLAHEFSINVNKKSHKIELTADVFNFTNLLNKNWGKRYFASFGQVQLLEQRGFLADKTTPTFSFDPNNADRINQVDDLGLQSSRWQMQVGVRYSFE
ncbi:TonB-dependent receptor [Flavobacterium sp. W22_SRS_FP1]|uniref:TonB-dependent receptor n=1 Tax=Flavobacterium sp. W22_SRS_FP1 TaxID=3240276 RepID=UPI003F8D9C0B